MVSKQGQNRRRKRSLLIVARKIEGWPLDWRSTRFVKDIASGGVQQDRAGAGVLYRRAVDSGDEAATDYAKRSLERMGYK